MQAGADTKFVFAKLSKVSSMEFTAQSSRATGWNGAGIGQVSVSQQSDESLEFDESGTWTNRDDQRFQFRNTYRWSLLMNHQAIRLEHLRLGHDHPVHLFDLGRQTRTVLTTLQPHVCGDDLYSAKLQILDSEILLNWTVVGPEKDETIHYVYR